MKLSMPIHQLKRRAKILARNGRIPLHAALDQIATEEGFPRWSLLAAKAVPASPSGPQFARLEPGQMVLIGARPGQGKTLTALRLAVEAMRAGNRAVVFTLEYNKREVFERLDVIGVEDIALERVFECDNSDEICADHIIQRLADAPKGTIAIVDYLQILDQDRRKPALMDQLATLRKFAQERAVILVFVSQIDRSYDPELKPYPDLEDVRLPNPVDLALFDRSYFLNRGVAA
jgi:replicative DNA helicase